MRLTPIQRHDITQAEALLADVQTLAEAVGRPIVRLLADKGYDSDPLRQRLLAAAIEPVIPYKSRQYNPKAKRGPKPTRPESIQARAQAEQRAAHQAAQAAARRRAKQQQAQQQAQQQVQQQAQQPIPEVDFHTYRDRNLVERLFNRLKYFRRVFTRYDKLAVIYLGFCYFAAAIDWLR